MGSQASKENYSTDQSNIPTKTNDIKNIDIKSLGLTISSIDDVLNNSSYNGINNSKQKNIDYNIEQGKTINEENIKNYVKFFWKEGGEEVFITGTFCDWKKIIKMHKNNDNIFEAQILLIKGKYEFKFIVDGIWKCSSYYPQIKDNRGIINNYFDNTNSSNINNFDAENNSINGNITNFRKNKNFSNILRGNLEEMKNNYNNIYPFKDQLNQDAPKMPDVFEILMDLKENSNQKYIGNKRYLNFSIFNFDDSFKNILQPFHSYLNHLFTYNNLNILSFPEKQDENSGIYIKTKKKNFIGINCNIKIKNKYISIVYYTPLNKTYNK